MLLRIEPEVAQAAVMDPLTWWLLVFVFVLNITLMYIVSWYAMFQYPARNQVATTVVLNSIYTAGMLFVARYVLGG